MKYTIGDKLQMCVVFFTDNQGEELNYNVKRKCDQKPGILSLQDICCICKYLTWLDILTQ